MAVIKPAFMRPVEITSENDTISIYYSGSWNDVPIQHGVYSCIKAVLDAFYNEADDDSLPVDEFTIEKNSADDDLQVTLSFSSSVMLQATSLLGFTGYESPGAATSFTGTMRPEYCWVPTYQVANQSRFFVDQKEVFHGSMSRSGALAGIGNGTSQIFYRQLDFVNELAENVSLEAVTSSCEALRCAELFFWQCRTVNPSVSTYPSPRGFYFYPDWTHVDTYYPGQQDKGGINFDYTTNPDRYVFCQCDKAGYGRPTASLPTTRDRYTVSLEIHSITDAPSWELWTAPLG